jgi:hypothetical protein
MSSISPEDVHSLCFVNIPSRQDCSISERHRLNVKRTLDPLSRGNTNAPPFFHFFSEISIPVSANFTPSFPSQTRKLVFSEHIIPCAPLRADLGNSVCERGEHGLLPWAFEIDCNVAMGTLALSSEPKPQRMAFPV